ncbi:MAG: sulfatase, partial [Krumholzibacteria bacterium]|nr:sulfatase [Candidatus Krumholzibacteria bacterium]
MRRLAELIALAGFALLQPLLDMLARFPDFLVVHDARVSDVALLVALGALGLPLVCWLAVVACGAAVPVAGRVLHGAFLGLLFASALLP